MCGGIIFPPRDICPECREEALPKMREQPSKREYPSSLSLDKRILHGEQPKNVVFFGSYCKERGG